MPDIAGDLTFATVTETGVRLGSIPSAVTLPPMDQALSPQDISMDLVEALHTCAYVYADNSPATEWAPDHLAKKTLVVPRSERGREALSTALIGSWSDPLFESGFLYNSALGTLKAEFRSVHRQLVPLWRRKTRHGRVLSLDADLGDGLSLYDLVVADVDHLAHTASGVFDDERLNAVLRSLEETERRVVLAYAEGEGTTWTEAAAVVGAADPQAFGERVRRKARRLAAEQQRRAEHRRDGRSKTRTQDSLPVAAAHRTER